MDKYISITINAHIEKSTFDSQEIKQGLFKGKSVNRAYQTFKADKEQLALDIAKACNDQEDKGYELISSTPIESRILNHDSDINSGWGFRVSVDMIQRCGILKTRGLSLFMP